MQKKEKMTVSLYKETIEDIEKSRLEKTLYPRKTDNKSEFVEKLLIIGLHAYKQKQNFFDTINFNSVDLSKINY
jgi:hypothetical protein